MIYLVRNEIKIWGQRLRFRDMRVENLSDFDKLVRVLQHGLQGFWAKKSKIDPQRQTILMIFCISESMELIISSIAIIFTNLNP